MCGGVYNHDFILVHLERRADKYFITKLTGINELVKGEPDVWTVFMKQMHKK